MADPVEGPSPCPLIFRPNWGPKSRKSEGPPVIWRSGSASDLWHVGRKLVSFLRSCWTIDLRFFLSNSLERSQGSWRWKSLTDITELQKCEILVSILVRQISVLPAGKKKNEKSCGSLVTFSQEHPSSVHTKPVYTNLPAMLRGWACYVRASKAIARERRRKVKERPSYSSLSPAPFSARSLSRVLPSLDSTIRKGAACNRVKDWCSNRLHAYTCLDMALWKPAFRGVNVKKIHFWKNDTSNRTLFVHVKKNNTSNRKHSGA